MKRFTLIPALFVFLLIAACGKDSENPTGPGTASTYIITGLVIQNSAGLSGVTVRLVGTNKDTTATTDSTGSYTFTGIPNGTYTITPSKTDVLFTQQSIQITVNGENVIVSEFSGMGDPHLTFVSIPGGTFQMGDEVGDLNQKYQCLPVHTVTLTGFEMSVYEITNTQYCAYLNAAKASGDITVVEEVRFGVWPSCPYVKGAMGAYSERMYLQMYYSSLPPNVYPNNCWIRYSNNTFTVETGYENWPVVWVTWYGAKAFALYYGLDLPTESEWEYACRGGRQYKYGTDDGTISTTKANYNCSSGYCHVVNVGSYPANPYGLYDMSGNAWEWVHDWVGTYPSGSVTNPTGAQTGPSHVLRGGQFSDDASYCRSALRYGPPVDFLDIGGANSTGFRVVRRAGGVTY